MIDDAVYSNGEKLLFGYVLALFGFLRSERSEQSAFGYEFWICFQASAWFGFFWFVCVFATRA